jgi:hypothetical protein
MELMVGRKGELQSAILKYITFVQVEDIISIESY